MSPSFSSDSSFNNSNSTIDHHSLTDWSYAKWPDVGVGWYYFSVVYLVCVGTFGLSTNWAIVYAFFKSRTIRNNPQNLLLLNLIICDLVIACYGIPVDTLAAAMRGWRLPRPLCQLTGFLLNQAGMCSIFTLTGLSYQRYVVMTQPNWVDIEGKGSTVCILFCVWAAGLAMAVPPIVGFGAYVPEIAGISCSSAWGSWDAYWYNIYLLVLGFYVPLLIIFYTSISVCRRIKQNFRDKFYLGLKTSAQKKDIKASGRTFLMIFAFLFTWSPYAIISTYQLFLGELCATWTVFPVLFAKSCICWNPVIYVYMHSQMLGMKDKSNMSSAKNALRARMDRLRLRRRTGARRVGFQCYSLDKNWTFNATNSDNKRKEDEDEEGGSEDVHKDEEGSLQEQQQDIPLASMEVRVEINRRAERDLERPSEDEKEAKTIKEDIDG